MKSLFRALAFCVGFQASLAAAFALEPPAVHGFLEAAYGARISRDRLTKHQDYNLLEQRLQLKTRYGVTGQNRLAEWATVFSFKGDLLLDEYFETTFDAEVRELAVSFRPMRLMDVKLGRQVLTWGTGDYLFINDLFPKDYVSFYAGRDDEYLKKPSDALRVSLFPEWCNIDFVAIGHFTPNVMPDGDRLSFFDSFQSGIAGRSSERTLVAPARQAENLQYALRLYRTFGSTEYALYYFRGFDPAPRSYLSEANRELFYERLDAYGFSVRGSLLGGIGSLETGYYHSPQDDAGDNRLIQNSRFRSLLGYEKDLGQDWKLGLQYQYEQTLDYAAYARALVPMDFVWDRDRHLLTQRLTKLFKNQTVQAGLFNFYSPADRDGYARLFVSYDITDQWKATCGVNLPWGEDMLTDFGMMKKNKNVFVRVRYTF